VAQLFLDCDGVLADFDAVAIEIFGQHPNEAERTVGSDEFWRRLRLRSGFFRDLPLLNDALELYHAVAHLDPTILTGCPRGGWAEPQKLNWAAQHFPGVRIITCSSHEKRLHMQSGDILVDDLVKYQHLWEEAGGIFVLHLSARKSLDRLEALGLEVRRSLHPRFSEDENHGRPR
jgi:hypothetical protein